MKRACFQVEILGHPISLADWTRALAAPKSELPKLDAYQTREARKFGEAAEEYARRELAGQYGEERMRDRAERLGQAVERVLKGLGPHYELLAIIADMFKDRWILIIKTPEGQTNVAVPRELGDDVVDWDLREKRDELREKLRYGLGLDDVAASARR